jgi:hypothetical protein
VLAGQRHRQLQIGVDAGQDAAQQLQNERISVDDRGVGLLGRHHPWHQIVPELLPGVALEVQRADLRPRPQRLKEQIGGAWVVQRLVHRPPGQWPLFGVADQRGCQPWRERFAHADQELVAVAGMRQGTMGGSVRLMGPYEQMQQPQLRVPRQQLDRRDQRETGHRAPFAREPPLPRQPLAQQRIQGREETRARRGGAGDGFRHGVASFPHFLRVASGARRCAGCY